MTEKALYVVDVIGKMVKQAEAKILQTLKTADPGIESVNYEFGHGVEILRTLKQMDESLSFQGKKYPLVALLQDFTEKRGTQPGIYCEVDLTVIICHHTTPELVSKERYEKVFKPILYPLYLEFIEQLTTSGVVLIPDGGLSHEKTDHPFYGREGKTNVGCDFLDAIEISDLKLKFYEPNC